MLILELRFQRIKSEPLSPIHSQPNHANCLHSASVGLFRWHSNCKVSASSVRLEDSITFFARPILSLSNLASGRNRPTHSTSLPSIVTYDDRNSSEARKKCASRVLYRDHPLRINSLDRRIAALSSDAKASCEGYGQSASGSPSEP